MQLATAKHRPVPLLSRSLCARSRGSRLGDVLGAAGEEVNGNGFSSGNRMLATDSGSGKLKGKSEKLRWVATQLHRRHSFVVVFRQYWLVVAVCVRCSFSLSKQS